MAYVISPVEDADLEQITALACDAISENGIPEYLAATWPHMNTTEARKRALSKFARMKASLPSPEHFLKISKGSLHEPIASARWTKHMEMPHTFPAVDPALWPNEDDQQYAEHLNAEKNKLALRAYAKRKATRTGGPSSVNAKTNGSTSACDSKQRAQLTSIAHHYSSPPVPPAHLRSRVTTPHQTPNMTTQTSPPPTQSAPGDRARQLTAVFARALKNALKPITSYPNFAACFPTPASYCDVALRELHSDFVRKLQGTCESEFEALLVEREVVTRLNELDFLVEEGRKRRARVEGSEEVKGREDGEDGKKSEGEEVVPHLMPPEALLKAHLSSFVKEEGEGVQRRIHDVEGKNQELIQEVKSQREEIEGLIAGLEGIVKDVEAANGVLRGGEMEGMEAILKG
ncbi:MAG: hypothetical protein Q9159_002552 [Coniocarpon cinnabarinum]